MVTTSRPPRCCNKVFFTTPSRAYSAYWRLLRGVTVEMWNAGEKHKAGNRERSVVCVELRGRGSGAKLLVVLEKTTACLLVVTAYPHGGCRTHYVVSMEELLRESTP